VITPSRKSKRSQSVAACTRNAVTLAPEPGANQKQATVKRQAVDVLKRNFRRARRGVLMKTLAAGARSIFGHAPIAIFQIIVLIALNQVGYLLAEHLHLPLPGNLVGMLLLLALLASGVVRLSWIESGASILLRHLAFFFVPIAVGLMAFTDLLQRDGLSWLVTLVLAAGVGIWAAGSVTQALALRARPAVPPLPVKP
jgi:holin-like protein